jgi:hypothetical protein
MFNLVNLFKTFDSSLGQYMRKAGRPSGGMESSNPRRWRGKRLHHHGSDVCCVFVLCDAVSTCCFHLYLKRFLNITLTA